MKHLKTIFACMLMAVLSIGQLWAEDVSFAFTTIGSTGWSNSYADHSVDCTDGTVTMNASKQTSNITDVPVTKGQPVSFVLSDGTKSLSAVSFTCTQWTTKAQTITLKYSTDGGSSYSELSPTVTSTNFSISSSSLPTGTNAVQITFSSQSNQVGVASMSYTMAGGTPSPSLSASPTTIDFGTVEQGASVAAKTVAVTFSNLTGSVTYSGLSGAFAATGTIANSGDEITITPSTATIGNYNQTLTIESTADSKSQDVTVTMNVVEPFDGLELTFPDYNDKGVSAYTSSWTATKSGQVWNIANFNNNSNGWSLIKAGRNGNASVATITTQVEDHAVSEVTVTVDGVDATKINSHKLYVADNSSFTDAIEIEGDPATIAAGDVVYTIPVANRDNDLYYKLEYDCASGSSNGFLQISKITYAYAAATPQKTAAGLAYDAADAQKLAKVGGTLVAPTLTNPYSRSITYTSGNTDVIEVNASTGEITAIKAAGKAVITASSEEDATYKAGTATYTIFVATEAGTESDPLTEASAKTLIDDGCTLTAHVNGVVATAAYNSTYSNYTVTLTGGLQFFRLKDLSNADFTSDYLKAGDELTAVGALKKYNTTYELDEGCYLTNYVEYTAPKTSIANDIDHPYTVAQALAFAADPVTYEITDPIYIAGVVYDVKNFNSTNGTLDIYVKDAGETNKFEFFKCKGIYDASLTQFTAADDVQVDDEVIGYGVMKYYAGGSIWEFDNTATGDYLVYLNRPAVPTYSITYVENGANEDIADVADATNLPDPLPTVTKADKAFGGWYTTSTFDGGTEAVAGAALTGDVILYAKWNDLSPWASVYTSNVEIASNTAAHVTINEVNYDAVKTSKGASATITLPQGVTTIHLHLVAWKDEAQTVSVTGDCFNDTKELTIVANDGVSGSGTTYALGATGVNYYFSLTPDNAVAANTEITIAAEGSKRFVLFGVNQEGGVLPVLESIEISGDLTNKTGYKVGDALDLDGLTVEATYSLGGVNQTPVDITNDPGLTLTYDPLVENQTEVTITATFGGETDDITITGLEAVASATPEIITDVNSRSWTVTKDAAAADKTFTVTLSNVAAATAALGGTNPGAFSIDKADLVDGDVITVSVVSTATVGSYTATITISDNAGVAADKVVTVNLTVNEPEVPETPVATTSKWVEATSISNGMEVIIVGMNGDDAYAMGEQGSNNRAAVAGALDEGVFTPGDNTMSFTLVDQGDGTYAIKTSNNKYLYAAASGSNHMKTQATVNENAKWTLAVNSAVAEGSSNRNVMQFNSGSSIFSCYATASQKAIAFYVPQAVTPVADYTRDDSWIAPGELGTVCIEHGVASIEGANIYELSGKDASGNVVFASVATMEPGKPYLFEATANKVEFFYSADPAVSEPDNSGAMKGTFIDMNITTDLANTYYFEGHTLYSAVDYASLEVLANRAYIKMDEVPTMGANPAPGKRYITLSVHGANGTTGVGELNASEAPVKMIIDGQLFIIRGEKMYNANGQLVK